MVSEPSVPRTTRWVPLALLALALLLRLRGLITFPLEQDELYTVQEATQLFHTTLKPGISGRPLYYLLEHVLLAAGPATPLLLRLPPLLFGLAGVWATWRLGARLFGVTAGWVAGLLVAISPWHLYMSGFARYWSLVYLLVTLLFLCLALAASTDRSRDYAGAAVTGILGSLTHPTFLFAGLGAALGAQLVMPDGTFGWRWPSRRAWRWLWGPWAAVLVAGYAVLRLTGQVGALRNFQGRGLLATLRLLPAMVQWTTPTVCAAGGMGALLLLALRERPAWRRFGAMALVGIASTTVLLFVLATRTDVYADYGIAMLPLVFVASGALVALGAEQMVRGGGWFAAAAATVIAAGVLPSTVSHLSDGTRFDYRPALRAVAATAPTVPVLTWPIVIGRYYAPGLDNRELDLRPEALDAALAAAGDLWVILSVREYGLVGDDTGQGSAWLATHCRPVLTHQGVRLDSRVYRVELERCRKVP